ncbi:MAG: hypothetical protein FWG11_05950 [Promicromonosporaceae bacterium]|nr:hypothetical protein [Promicromonosporaceae bacterium]
MKKRSKALAAVAAGALLVVPGATFALWTDTASLGADSVRTGQLALDWGAPLAWSVDGQPVTNARLGDTLVGTTTVDASLLGRNLSGDLTYDAANLLDSNWIAPSAVVITVGGIVEGQAAVTVTVPIPSTCGPGHFFRLGQLGLTLRQQRGDGSGGWVDHTLVDFTYQGEVTVLDRPYIDRPGLTYEPKTTNNGVVAVHFWIAPAYAGSNLSVLPDLLSALGPNLNLLYTRWTDSPGGDGYLAYAGSGDGTSPGSYYFGNSAPLTAATLVGPEGGWLTLFVQRTSGGYGRVNPGGWFTIDVGGTAYSAPFPAIYQGEPWVWPSDSTRPEPVGPGSSTCELAQGTSVTTVATAFTVVAEGPLLSAEEAEHAGVDEAAEADPAFEDEASASAPPTPCLQAPNSPKTPGTPETPATPAAPDAVVPDAVMPDAVMPVLPEASPPRPAPPGEGDTTLQDVFPDEAVVTKPERDSGACDDGGDE